MVLIFMAPAKQSAYRSLCPFSVCFQVLLLLASVCVPRNTISMLSFSMDDIPKQKGGKQENLCYWLLLITLTLFQDVIRALNRSPKVFLPPDATFSIVQPFIREACKLSWNMSALAHPLDICVATDAELFDNNK